MVNDTAVTTPIETDEERERRLEAEAAARAASMSPRDRLMAIGATSQPSFVSGPSKEEIDSNAKAIPAPRLERIGPLGSTSAPPVGNESARLQPIAPAAPAVGSSADYQGRLQKLRDQDANPWGSENNHPGIGGRLAHIAAKVGNIAGDIVAPNTMALIPGTELNRKVQEHGLEDKIAGAETRENAAAAEKTREKHEENVEDVNKQKADLAVEKEKDTESKNKSAREVALRKLGMSQDENGLAVPLKYEDMSPTEQAHHDLTAAQTEVAKARADYEKTKADPDSPQNKQARDRIRVAAKNAATAAGKLGLDEEKYAADYLGVDKNGNPISGTQTDEKTGKPIGVKVGKGNEATADRLKRSDLARNVMVNTDGIREIIGRRPDLFGKIAGRMTTVQQMLGSDDPDIAKMGVAIHNAALASNGAHGVRSAEAVEKTEKELLNHFRNGPEATISATQELDKSVSTFIEDAKLGKHPGRAPNEPTANAGGSFKVPDGAPEAPKQDGKVLKMDGKVVARSKGGQWQAP